MIPLRYLIATELRMGMRTRLFRIFAVVLFAVGIWTGNVEGVGAAMSAYATGEAACQYLSLFGAIWSALGALRDTAQRVDVLIFTKPQPPERLALARFFGLMGQLLALLAALFLGAMVGRWLVGHTFLGYGAYGLQYLRAAGVLFFAAGASYSLALLGQSAIAGGLVCLALIVAISGKAFLPKHYFPWYAQNLPAFVAGTIGLLAIALWLSRRRLRGERPASLALRVTVPVALFACALLFDRTIRTGHDPMAREDPGLLVLSTQTITEGRRAPGFLLPDQKGRPTSLSQFPGTILLLALWSPQEVDSALLLAELSRIYRLYGNRGVLPIAVCLSEDSSTHATFAIGENLPFPVVQDWGTHNAAQMTERSPLALAYHADRLPFLAITDRRHRVRALLDGTQAYSHKDLMYYLEKRLKAEPE